MAAEVSLKTRKALGKLLKELTDTNPKAWENHFWDNFSDLDLIPEPEISNDDYKNELRNLPRFGKRRIMHWTVMGWNKHHDPQALYQAIIKLISLNVCGPTEYFTMQYIYNFINDFNSLYPSDNIRITQNIYTPYRYILSFGFLFDRIQFDLNNPVREEPSIQIFTTYSILEKKYGSIDVSNPRFVAQELLMPLVDDEFARNHFPWINSDMEIGLYVSREKDGLRLSMQNLIYSNEYG